MTKSFSAAITPLLITALLTIAAASTGVAQTSWPTEQWPTTTPEAVGLNSATLDSIDAEIRAGEYGYVDRFLVIRNGQLTYDRRYHNDYDRIYGDSARVGTTFLAHHRAGPYNYFNSWWHPYYRRGDLHTLQSVTKTVTSMVIGAAVTRDEFPSLDTPVLSFFDSGTVANVDDRKRRMTVRHLLTMTAGLDWDEEGAVLGEEGTVDALESSYDWVQFTIDRPMAEEPGTRFNYNSGASQLLSHIFHEATGFDIEEYAARHLFAPLGITEWFWKRTPAGLPDTEGGLYLTSEDLAKLWLLFLRDGTWDGQEVVSPDWVRASVAPAIAVPDPVRPSGVHYGLKWWLHPNPTDSTRLMWLGSGFGGQFPIAIPEQDLIIVINQWNILPPEPWLIPEPIVARILQGMTEHRPSGLFPSEAPDIADASEVPVTVPDLGVRVAVEGIAPVIPVRADGDFHLFYELRLTGFDPRVLRLEHLEVLNGESAPEVLASYGPPELEGMIASPGPESGDRLSIVPGSQSVLFLWVVIDSATPLPTGIRHRLSWIHAQSGENEIHRLETDAIPISREPPLVISPPVRGGLWYAGSGPDNSSHHRRALAPRDGRLTMDQRFATDWFLLGHAGAAPGAVSYLGPDWPGTAGTEVLAVADGRVVSTVDGIPDDPVGGWGASGTVLNWETIGGNAITLDLGGTRFAWYGHLQAGSLQVQPGDSVRRGQVLGRIGNSGATTAPHLHFEITDSSTLGKGNGLPFVFECFDLMARTNSRVQWTGEGELYLHMRWSLAYRGVPAYWVYNSLEPVDGGEWARVRALEAAMADLQRDWGTPFVAWGEVSRLQRPVDGSFSDDWPSTPVAGSSGLFGLLHEFNPMPVEGQRRWYGRGGNSYVSVVEFGPEVRARTVLPFGQSWDPESPHYADQSELYGRGELKPVWTSLQEVRANAVQAYRLGERRTNLEDGSREGPASRLR